MIKNFSLDNIHSYFKKKLSENVYFSINDNKDDLNPLHESQLKIYKNLQFKKRKDEYLMGRTALNSLSKHFSSYNLSIPEKFPSKNFSLTHTDHIALASVSIDPSSIGLGIDMEFNRTIKEKSQKFFLNTNEQKHLLSKNKSEHLLRLWTVKEALFKSNMKNKNSLLKDYEISNSMEITGTAYLKSNHKIKFIYSSLKLNNGFISLAIAQ